MTTRVSRAWRPMSTSGRITASCTFEYERTSVFENTTEFDTCAPEMMQPPDTRLSIATPRRSCWLCTNLAGGSCGW